MSTLENDFVRLHLDFGVRDFPLTVLDLEWPPPERLYLGKGGEIREATEDDESTFVLVRTSMSELPDNIGSDHIARGAQYRYEEEIH